MNRMSETSARRPLKSRATHWARLLSQILVRTGISANTISVISVLFAFAAAGVFVLVANGNLGRLWLVCAAVLLQMRLLCNLMDGMVAIEGGKKTATGDLFNEVPDRIADVVILAGMGLCASWQPYGVHLGWLAASLAVMTAYVRMQGVVLTGTHDFCGPMAKPQRMALVTLICVLSAILPTVVDWVLWGLTAVVIGELVTVYRRLVGIAKYLNEIK